MRGFIDRITNRDRLKEMEALIDEKDSTLKQMGTLIDEKDSMLKQRDRDLEELEELADTLGATVRVLKMRMDMIIPAGQPGVKPDERSNR